MMACTGTSCIEHVGTWTASAGRMPDGGAEQRQRRRGEDGPSQQKRALSPTRSRCDSGGGRSLCEQKL
jgi:hypothetical protein